MKKTPPTYDKGFQEVADGMQAFFGKLMQTQASSPLNDKQIEAAFFKELGPLIDEKFSQKDEPQPSTKKAKFKK